LICYAPTNSKLSSPIRLWVEHLFETNLAINKVAGVRSMLQFKVNVKCSNYIEKRIRADTNLPKYNTDCMKKNIYVPTIYMHRN
jgi:hypothetical protein